MSSSDKSYRKAGVDINAADSWVASIEKNASIYSKIEKDKLISGVGSYAAVYALSQEEWVATSCDGVGTKILWSEIGLGTPEGMAQDLLAMNANDLLCVGATPKLFLDYIAVGNKDHLRDGEILNRFVKGLHRLCADTGQMLVGGETAQLPDIYPGGGFDLAGFSIGFLKPEDHLSIENVNPGQQIWGWPSSGPHASGFSWIRKLFDSKKDQKFIQENLMNPTRLYVNELSNLRTRLKVKNLTKSLTSAFHITGSGFLNLIRAQPQNRTVGFEITGYSEKNWPSWAQEIARRSGASKKDLYTTFNMGLGFVLVFDPEILDLIGQEFLTSSGLRFLGATNDTGVVHIDGINLE